MSKSLVEGAPPPIPQDARKPSQEKVEQAQRAVLQFMPEAAQVAGALALVAKKTRDGFHEQREQVLELANLVNSFYKKNPKGFENAMQQLQAGGNAWMALDKAIMDSGTQAYQSFNKLHSALNTFAQNVQPAKKLPADQLMAPSDKRKKLEMLLVKERKMDPEEAKDMVSHISDEKINKMVPASGILPPVLVRFKGKLYRRASVLSQLRNL